MTTTNKTLHLPQKASPSAADKLVAVPSASDIEKYLRDNGLMVIKAPESGVATVGAIPVDTTLNNPVVSNRPDMSRLPPPGERSSAPVQLPPRVWGNSRFLTAK